MRLRELLVERVSLSKHSVNLNKNILQVASNAVFKLLKQHNVSSVEESVPILQNAIVDVTSALTNYLTSEVKSITGKQVQVQFASLSDGDGKYKPDDNILYITKKTITGIIPKIIQYRFTKLDSVKTELNQRIHRLTEIFLHESSHVIQMAASGKPYPKSMVYNKGAVDDFLSSIELKSKKQRTNYKGDKEDLNKNRLNVFLRLAEPDSEINIAIDRAQPEEISAYANQYSTEIINKLQKFDRDEQKTELKNILKTIQSGDIAEHSKTMKDYAIIVKKYNKKPYQKFLKLVYQELDSYLDSL